MMEFPRKVKIREVVLRDGFQSWPEFVPTETKLEVIKAVISAGVSEFETTAFISPKVIPQMADAADVIKAVPKDNVTHAVLVPNLKGAELAVAAGAKQFNVVISASEAHNMANFRRPISDSLAALEPIFQLAEDNNVGVIGAVAVAFGCPFSGKVAVAEVLKLIETFVSCGSQAIALGDTTGMATPMRVQQMVETMKDHFPDKEISLHLHNNRGTGMANLLAGLQSGATMFDTSLGGIGGCPNVPQASGNLATEDVVCMLEDMGIDTGINLEVLLEAARFLEKRLNQILPGQVLKSGPILPIQDGQACKAK
jgi:hydroxymethylglutaryl-CoA lyase